MTDAPIKYPWQSPLYDRLQAQHGRGQLPHALLMAGPPGIGKEEFIESWVGTLVCRDPATRLSACGTCDRCLQHASGSYPDCMVLAPEPEARRVFQHYPVQQCQLRERSRKTARTIISVDQVRELISKLAQSSHYGGLKIVVILPADALNTEAANALLKVLEEPPNDTLFLLLSERPLKLMATLRSRCQRIDMPIPATGDVVSWLGDSRPEQERQRALLFTGGSPRLARELLASGDLDQWLKPIEQLSSLVTGKGSMSRVADEWEKHDRRWLTGLLQSWLRTLIGSYAGVHESDANLFGNNLRVQKDGLHLAGVFELSSLLGRYVATENIALNNRLMWEEFLLCWQSKCLKKNKAPR